MFIVTVYILSTYNAFLYFLEGKGHKDSKLGVMINMGKSRLAKSIFTNIHKISDACANSSGGYKNSSFSIKKVLLIKLKLIYPITKKKFSPTPI